MPVFRRISRRNPMLDRTTRLSDPANVLAERQTRAAVNQSVFRDANEQTHREHPGSAFVEYRCECTLRTCDVRLSLSPDEYEEVRRSATHFVVAHGHVAPLVECVVRE